MKSQLMLVGLGIVLSLTSCTHTSEGIQKDVHEDSIKASNGLRSGIDSGSNLVGQAGQKVHELQSTAAITLRIKNAINADAKLNDSRNSIDVDTTREFVKLDGHVYSSALKDKAASLALEEMKKAHATQELRNELSVKP